MIKKIIIFNVIFIICIITYLHFKKYNYISHEYTIEQIENFIKSNIEKSIKNKNPIVIRNIEYNIENKDKIDTETIETTSLFNLFNEKNENINNILSKISSPLSIRNFDNNYINYGKIDVNSPILQLKYDRTFIHVLSGNIKCYLFHPLQVSNLYLQKSQGIFKSNINTNNPNYELYPKYKNENSIIILLRKYNILYIPNHWAFYIEHLDNNAIYTFYNSHTLLSKILI